MWEEKHETSNVQAQLSSEYNYRLGDDPSVSRDLAATELVYARAPCDHAAR